MRKKLLSILALLCLTASGAWADDSGTCGEEGDNVTWSFTDAGVLTISGTGAMADGGPWLNNYWEDITSVVISEGVTVIGAYTFTDCPNLASVSIPASVTTIGNLAFAACGSNVAALQVTIIEGSSLTTIGRQAFISSNLNAISIPASVTTIGPSAFSDCKNLTAITVAADNPNYSSDGGVLFNKPKTTLIKYPIGNTGTNYEIPASVTTIEDGAFAVCSNLTAITVADGNTNFSSYVGVLFNYDKTTLIQYPVGKSDASYTIPASVTTIGLDAFTQSGNLTSVTIGSNVESIGFFAFGYCTSLATVDFGSNVKITTIADQAFAFCPALTSVNIPASVTSIGYGAFDYCYNLTTVTLNSNPFIDNYAFEGIASSATVTMNLTANSGSGAYWTTFYNENYSFTADGSTTIYKGAVSSDKSKVELTAVTDIPKNNAAVLKSTVATITLTLDGSASAVFTGNALQGSSTPIDASAMTYAYCLSNETTRDGGLTPRGVGFYTFTGTIPANRAYLVVDGGPSSARSYLGFGDDDNSTGIAMPEAVAIEGDSPVYDLSGRRVAGQPVKGIYVKNGKIVVIK